MEQEAVIVLPDKGEVKVLNEVGARIWALADGSRSVREIAATIASLYDVPPSQAEAGKLASCRRHSRRCTPRSEVEMTDCGQPMSTRKSCATL